MLRYFVLAMTVIVGLIPWQAFAQDEASLRGGVVKIMSTNRDGMHSTGTGFVVKAEGSSVYIVTAAHVVANDPNPRVEFFTRRNTPVTAEMLKKDLRYDLALLKAESPQPPMVLGLEASAMPKVGDEVTTIGSPRTGGAWLLGHADLAGRDGADLILSGGAIDEGSSGGPVIKDGKVIGVVHGLKGKFAIAMPVSVVAGTLEGWGVAMAADTPKPTSEDTKSTTNAQIGSIDYSNFSQVKKAAERSDPRAMFQLGEMYSDGKAVQENFAEAAKWYRRGADAGYPEAHTSMGMISLIKAIGLADSDESAVRFGSDESKKSEFISMVIHSERLQIRNQMALKESVKWLRMGAEQGHDANAQFVLGLLTGAGVGVEKDPVQGAKWIRLAATKEPAAQAFMGIYYLTGRGVEKDFVEAARRLREAAGKEVPIAYAPLGMMYAEGLGVVKDYAEASKWLRKGVQHGDPEAKGYLGMLYLLGWGGPQDLPQAYSLAREAAEQGDQTGQFVLGVMFFSGNGVPQNPEESLKWMQASARQGYSPAQEFLRERGQNW
ncbi:MAG: trypsin-like peptidase domain-containing protein [Nitrospirota bacterium]